MALVINWKSPKGVDNPAKVEEFFRAQNVEVEVSQCHRVPSGKLNTTFDGDETEINKAWRIIKNMEKEEIKKRLRQWRQ